MKCGVHGAKCEMECKVWRVECEVRSVEWRVESVKCREWEVWRDVES